MTAPKDDLVERLTVEDRSRLERIVREPFRVYSPSAGGGRDYATLIENGHISVEDVGDEQETILLVSATPAGRTALQEQGDV